MAKRRVSVSMGVGLLLLGGLHVWLKTCALDDLVAATKTSLEGKAVPTFELPIVQGLEGSTIRFPAQVEDADYQVLVFWASWCAPCRIELKQLARVQSSFEAAGGRIITVSLDDDVSAARHFLEENRLPLATIWDGDQEVAAKFVVKVIPTTIITSHGMVREQLEGLGDLSPGSVERLLESRRNAEGRKP